MARIAEAGGPTKTMPVRGAGVGELGPLRQEAVARMDAGGAGRLRGRDDLADVEVALARRRRPDRMRLVRHPDEERPRVGLRMHRDRAHAEPLRGADDPAGDLAAIGDEDAVEHGGSGCGMAGNGGGTGVEVKGPLGRRNG